MKDYLKIFLTILIIQNSLNADIYTNDKINESLKENISLFFNKETSFEELEYLVKVPEISPKGEFEKTKDYEERKKNATSKLDLNRIFISNLDIDYITYDADKESIKINLADLQYGNKEFYIYYKHNFSSYTKKYISEFGTLFEAKVMSSQDKIFSIIDLNSFKLFDKNGSINFPLSIQEAKEFKDKLKAKVIYQHQNSAKDYTTYYQNDYPTINNKNHYMSDDKIIKIKPLAIVIYYDKDKIVALSTFEKLESLKNKLSTINNKFKDEKNNSSGIVSSSTSVCDTAYQNTVNYSNLANHHNLDTNESSCKVANNLKQVINNMNMLKANFCIQFNTNTFNYYTQMLIMASKKCGH